MTGTGQEYGVGDRVAFIRPGLKRDEHEGTVFEAHETDLFGWVYYVEDGRGRKLQLGETAILRILREVDADT